ADERTASVLAFLRRALAWFTARGVRVERVMTDNGSAYSSTMHAVACRLLGVRHLRTRPYRPQTNGKAERFIQTLLGGWAPGPRHPHRPPPPAPPPRRARLPHPPPTPRQPQPPDTRRATGRADEQPAWELQLAPLADVACERPPAGRLTGSAAADREDPP